LTRASRGNFREKCYRIQRMPRGNDCQTTEPMRTFGGKNGRERNENPKKKNGAFSEWTRMEGARGKTTKTEAKDIRKEKSENRENGNAALANCLGTRLASNKGVQMSRQLRRVVKNGKKQTGN